MRLVIDEVDDELDEDDEDDEDNVAAAAAAEPGDEGCFVLISEMQVSPILSFLHLRPNCS